MGERVIPFPQTCERSDYCIQTARLATLEAREQSQQSQLDRMEAKLDAILWWIIGTVVLFACGATSFAAAMALKKLGG